MTAYEDFIARKVRQFGDRFDPSGLDQRFVPYYNNRDRIKVVHRDLPDSEASSGTIGVTSGWKPSFLLMYRSSDRGSSYLLGPWARIVAVKPIGARSYRTLVPSK